ncbi:PA2169 family four-helix-bundle protein [Thioalkalivibrio sp.]|uniref:PA2169 family four-helix-bundle protein n=2 Tax=Thioalkalivibrio sp. TaxID=2093813 RepID=UPI003976DC39
MASTDTNSKEVIDVLNDLIETSKDGEEGFKECAENVERSYLKTLLKERARECKTAATELQTIVQRLGGTPEDEASATGSLHRRWTDLKATLTGNSEQAVLDECERGEDVAKESYQEALENQALPPDIRAVVERQYKGVLRNHDQVKALRDAERAR